MLICIRCISCNKVLADKWEWYRKECEKMQNTKEEEKHFNKNYTKELLDKLGLDRYCCRRMFLGHVDLIDEL
jgi:DNA-directed RNA polymerase subunit N (RpoN/RPB10)